MNQTNSSPQKDFPASLALLLFLGIGFLYEYLSVFRYHPQSLAWITNSLSNHSTFWWAAIASLAFNIAVVGTYSKRFFGLAKQGSKLKILEGKKRNFKITKADLVAFTVAAASMYYNLDFVTQSLYQLLKVFVNAEAFYCIRAGMIANFAVASFLLTRIVFQKVSEISFLQIKSKAIKMPETNGDEVILGTTSGDLTHETVKLPPDEINEDWIKLSGRGLNGGILVTGSPGSGKTAGLILNPLDQILKWKQIPSMLCIDPKGTFISNLDASLSKIQIPNEIVRLSLDGNQTFNPVYVEKPLKNSRFVELAEMVRAASANFLGKSGDSPFWDISSSNLIRYTIVYCAATLKYFTLVDLYRNIIQAKNKKHADDLIEALKAGSFDEEEKFNIQCAIEYFQKEYDQLEERVRSGIVATSTAFINLFQEYSANKVFCPKENEISIPNMEEFIKSGGVLLFDINKPGLARSMGTFVKLHYQQAILNSIQELKSKNQTVSAVIIMDEYQDVVTCSGGGKIGDESFMAKAREAKPLIIAATQSISSLINSVGSQRPVMELIQNFRNRIACHSSDIETINMFKELAGLEEKDSESHSFSESSKSSQLNLLVGGFDSADSSLNESISRAKKNELLVTGKDFSRLNSFEAFAQIFDGVKTRFIKLYLKPNFLKKINTPHSEVLESINSGSTEKKCPVVSIKFLFNIGIVITGLMGINIKSQAQMNMPSACTIVNTPAFDSCFELMISGCTCGIPPHPCALISYYVPQSFIEVWPEPRTTYFSAIPGASAQLASIAPSTFGAEGDDDTQSYHAHTLSIPMDAIVFSSLPGGGNRMEKTCFDGMSEHFTPHWQTGKGDLTQPLFLAWSVSPKMCLMRGALTSFTGEPEAVTNSDSAICSFSNTLPTFPPSLHSACNGWGTFYPRYGTYTGPASMTGALMIASRIKSLSAEVLHSMPSSPDEKWQMIYPGSSSCFREGQNVGLLESIKNVRELSRLTSGKLKGYLFAIWSKTVTCKEMPSIAQAHAVLAGIRAGCRGVQ